MFELKIVLALALVCLQVSGCPLEKIYNKLGDCFTNKTKFFEIFFPYKIEKFQMKVDKFSGTYTNVELSGLENVNFWATQDSNDNDSEARITFHNEFPKIVIIGNLEGNFGRYKFNGSVSGYAKDVILEGKVWCEDSKVTDFFMVVLFTGVSIKFDEGETPFDNEHTNSYFKKFYNPKRYELDREFIALINSLIDSPQKIAQLKEDCGVEV